MKVEMETLRLYAEAGRIIDIAMGREERTGRHKGERRSVADPLAYWCGVFAIVDLVRKPPSTAGEGK